MLRHLKREFFLETKILEKKERKVFSNQKRKQFRVSFSLSFFSLILSPRPLSPLDRELGQTFRAQKTTVCVETDIHRGVN